MSFGKLATHPDFLKTINQFKVARQVKLLADSKARQEADKARIRKMYAKHASIHAKRARIARKELGA